MSDDSRKDVVPESTDDLKSASNGSDAGAAYGEPDAAGDDDVLELGAHHIDEDGDDTTAQTSEAADETNSSQPPASKTELKDIPMARISMIPAAAGPAASNRTSAHDELFELQEGHVVEEGNVIAEPDATDSEQRFDYGTPEMVFDNGEQSAAGTERPTPSDLPSGRDAQLPRDTTPDAQPVHAVAVNQPPENEPIQTGNRHDSSDLIEAKGDTPSRISELKAAAKGKRISVDDLAAAVFDDEPGDGAPRESTLENYVSYMSKGDSSGPAMDSPETAFPGAVPSPEMSDAVGDDGGEDGEEEGLVDAAPADGTEQEDGELVTDVDIDITEEVEEMAGKTQPANASGAGAQKPPPPPPLAGSGRPVNSFFKNDKIDAANASLKLMAKTARKSRGRKKEWWATIFDDEYLMLLPERSPYEQQKQIDFIQRYLGLPPGALLLDLACGNGRNAIGMAQRNYRIVGVDLSLSMLARAGDAAQEAGQKINFIHGDMRDLGFDKTFDGVFSLDTSFGYFDEPTNMKVLQGIYRALKPGGTFLIELANRDFVIRQQPNMVWFQMDNMVCMEETDFNYINNRLYISRQLIIGDNEKQSKHEFSLRLYSLHEIGQLLHQAGFAVVKVSGHRATPGAFFGPESSKLIIIAERRGD